MAVNLLIKTANCQDRHWMRTVCMLNRAGSINSCREKCVMPKFASLFFSKMFVKVCCN